jgi:hypothetical protein
MAKSPYEAEPKHVWEVDAEWNNQDPVKLDMSDGSVDPVNGPAKNPEDESNKQPDPFRWNKK